MGNDSSHSLRSPKYMQRASVFSSSPFASDRAEPAVPLKMARRCPRAQLRSRTSLRTSLHRFVQFYRQDWHPTAAQGPAPPRRGLPSPLESPPFPNSDWSYGGSPVIGEPDTNSYPLMTAWNGSRGRTKVYGWVEPSLNFSTSADSNAPEANDVYSNRFEMDQLVVYVERLPDSVQKEHVDVGYHLTAFYGTDYKYTTDKGYFSSQLLVHNHQYGFDPVLEYIDIYIPRCPGDEYSRGPLHLHTRHRGAAYSEQLHVQPFSSLRNRSIYRHRDLGYREIKRPVADAGRHQRQP